MCCCCGLSGICVSAQGAAERKKTWKTLKFSTGLPAIDSRAERKEKEKKKQTVFAAVTDFQQVQVFFFFFFQIECPQRKSGRMKTTPPPPPPPPPPPGDRVSVCQMPQVFLEKLYLSVDRHETNLPPLPPPRYEFTNTAAAPRQKSPAFSTEVMD